LNLHSLVPRPTSASRAFDCRERSHASAITAWRTLLILVAFVFVRAGNAQNHPELHWQVLETEHFRVLYHEGLETAAGKAAEVAEEAYGPTTKLYGYEPRSKVRIILKDYDDFANGANTITSSVELRTGCATL
jgi:hypothetical protein